MSLKRKRDRFKGMSEDEVLMRMLPDHLVPNLDIVIVSAVIVSRVEIEKLLHDTSVVTV